MPVPDPPSTPSLPSAGGQPTAPLGDPLPLPVGLPPPVVPGYEILGELGRGGMGVVYRARQAALNRVVALKMIRADRLPGPEMVHRFLAEAEAVAAVRHPNVVQVHAVGTYA